MSGFREETGRWQSDWEIGGELGKRTIYKVEGKVWGQEGTVRWLGLARQSKGRGSYWSLEGGAAQLELGPSQPDPGWVRSAQS